MKTWLKIILCFTLVMLLSSCQSSRQLEFPKADIVYQAGNFIQAQLGFVNADGSNLVLLNTDEYFSRPVWSNDGKRLYGLTRSSQAFDLGYPAFWQPGNKYNDCHQWFNFDQVTDEVILADGSKHVLIKGAGKILLADLDTCKIADTLVDVSGQSELLMMGASYIPNGQLLLYGLQIGQVDFGGYHLMKMDMKTRQTIEIGAGINPSWSPNGKQIAYVQIDGIYVMNRDGTQPRQVHMFTFTKPSDGQISTPAPMPRWSPDGNWLVYQRCNKNECSLFEHTIYKLEISTGIEIEIVSGGVFPDWKK